MLICTCSSTASAPVEADITRGQESNKCSRRGEGNEGERGSRGGGFLASRVLFLTPFVCKGTMGSEQGDHGKEGRMTCVSRIVLQGTKKDTHQAEVCVNA